MNTVTKETGFSSVEFKTMNGNLYVYDSCTNRVFFVTPLMLELLKSYQPDVTKMSGIYPKDLTEDYYDQIHRSVALDGAFFQEEPEVPYPISETEYRKELGDNQMLQLFLIVSEDCNMRCKYCTYGGHYKFSREHNSTKMSFDVAKRAIDYFTGHVRSLRKDGHLPKANENAISFFGGEPLLNFGLLKRCIEYAKAAGPGQFYFSLTTNGTLLTDRIVDYLASNEVILSISLDGPENEHDRKRVYPSGNGTFRKIFGNLMRIREGYPDYYKGRVNILAVFDWKTDLREVARFFTEKESILPPASRWEGVNATDTTYYNQFLAEDKELLKRIFQECEEGYFDQLTGRGTGKFPSAVKLLFRTEAKALMDRNYSKRKRYTAACLPGIRLAVYPDGTFHICEKINHYFPIGDCENGIDFQRVSKILSNFYDQVIDKNGCHTCIARKLCSVCFATCAQDGKFDSTSACRIKRETFAQRLGFYYSILEENPNAFDDLKLPPHERLSVFDKVL